MNTAGRQAFISNMYQDLFSDAKADMVSDYGSPDFVEENNYDVLDYQAFEAHVRQLAGRGRKARFDLEFLVDSPDAVVVRALVYLDNQIQGAPPASLLISYWRFDDRGRVDYCKEVEYTS